MQNVDQGERKTGRAEQRRKVILKTSYIRPGVASSAMKSSFLFFTLIDHGITTEEIEAQSSISKAFFDLKVHQGQDYS